jgi:C-terminal processing protease CtpA/Prc
MRKRQIRIFSVISSLAIAALACSVFQSDRPSPAPEEAPTATAILPSPVQPGEANPDEPVLITGTIPFTSPFFINSIAEPFVLLEDEAGFANRDRNFEFPLAGQVIGPVEPIDDSTLRFTLALPGVPQGTLLDVDNNGDQNQGIMVFAVAYWSNTWGDPFLERRDGTGWSNAYTSAHTDSEREDEINGGKLIIWAPDEFQAFPSGFGADDLLFTDDDPAVSVPPGYSIVDLDETPFRIYKEAQPEFVLIEGDIAVNDLTDLDYEEAFEQFFAKLSLEYPFTEIKPIDWSALEAEYTDRVARVNNDEDFYRAIRDLSYEIPDGHVGLTINSDVFFEERGGGLGIVVQELTSGEVIVTSVLDSTPGSEAGIQVGAEILTWEGIPAQQAIGEVVSYFGPYSTDHHRRLDQAVFLTRMPPGDEATFTYINPGSSAEREVTLTSIVEYDSLFEAIPQFSFDELALPVDAYTLLPSGLGYLQLTTFSDDYTLMAILWDRFLSQMVENEVPGLIIDIRYNGGGNGGLALDFAGYFFDEEFETSEHTYYSEITGEFESQGVPARVQPADVFYEGQVALLIGPDCASACEGFANAMIQDGRSTVLGHFPSAGMFGEVGRGQYELPGDISLQFPTGRSLTPDGEILIEGTGIVPDIIVPVTMDTLFVEDTLLNAALDFLADRVR